jgi:hypothetical protein
MHLSFSNIPNEVLTYLPVSLPTHNTYILTEWYLFCMVFLMWLVQLISLFTCSRITKPLPKGKTSSFELIYGKNREHSLRASPYRD